MKSAAKGMEYPKKKERPMAYRKEARRREKRSERNGYTGRIVEEAL